MPRSIATLPLIVAAACSGQPDRPLTAAATWQIEPTPLVDIGSDPDDTLALIGNAVAAFAIGDSQIVVADRGYHQLRYFDRDGTLWRTSGREGDGPGEFRYIARMWRCGDSLVVYDIPHRLFTVHGLDGSVARSYFPTAPQGSQVDSPYKSACGPDGTWLSNGWSRFEPSEPRRVRDSIAHWLAGREGGVSVVLGRRPGSERFVHPNGSGPHPLGKEPVLAVGRHRAYLGTADSFAIEVFTLDGSPLDPIVKTSVQLATTEADIARHRLLDTLGKNEDDRTQAMRWWDQYEYPPTVPAYTALVVDRDDNLWVRSFPRTVENLVRWVVFDPAGVEIGSVDLPSTLEVFDIGTDWVLGIETRLEDGGQQVRMYRLRRD